jgi:hypothetical protein
LVIVLSCPLVYVFCFTSLVFLGLCIVCKQKSYIRGQTIQ